LGLAGKKTTVKPGARLAARKRAGAESVQPKPVQPKPAQPKSVQPKSAQPKSAQRKPVQRPDKGSRAPDAARTENARLAAELRDALARQTATSEILRVISGSPTDVQPVFDAIVLTAARLLRCDRAFIQRCDSAGFWTVASAGPHGAVPITQSAKAPLDPVANFPSRAIVAKKTLHLPDWSAIELPEFEHYIRELHGTRSSLYMPLLREGECIGLLAIIGKQANMFGDSEIALAEAFRDQALIAIENTRLFNETQEALEQQTATAEVLQVINASPGVLAPVFDAIVDKASRLCDADGGALWLVEGGMARVTGARGGKVPEPFYEYIAHQSIPAEYLLGENAPDRPYIHTADIKTMKAYQDGVPFFVANVELGGVRTVLTIPLTEGRTVVGVFTLIRQEVRPFTDKQIALVQSFAAQAQIAMKNANLINETREALERQTATADILKVIASSPSDVQPVFEKIVDSAARLFEPCAATIVTLRDGEMHWNATAALRPDFDVERARSVYPLPFAPDRLPSARAIAERRIVEIPDSNAPDTPDATRRAAAVAGFRSITFVPLINDNKGIGTIILTHPQAGFRLSEAQLALLQTFADQAVIAIENARLFNETREALERQTATADILKVIASSPNDVQPVFDVIVEHAVRLCGGRMGRVYRYDDGMIHMVAGEGLSAPGLSKVQEVYPRPAADDTTAGQAIQSRQPNFVTDIKTDQSVPPLSRQMIEALGTRSQVTVPMLRSGEPIGAITVGWAEPGAYGDQQVALLETFADQAVIAIENVRLFNETKEALEQQTATSDVLQAIGSSMADAQPVFERILDITERLFDCRYSLVFLAPGDGLLHLAARRGRGIDVIDAAFPQPIDQTAAFSVLEDRRQKYFPDVMNGADVPASLRRAARTSGGNFSAVLTPMLWEGQGIGIISLTREPNATINTKELRLLQTFADQAVIAIQNARLFNETREALERQTATADILKVIASSPSDVQPVFQAIAERSKRLVDALSTTVFRLEDGVMHLRAFTTTTPEADATLNAMFPAPLSDFSWGEAIGRGDIHRVVDTEQEIEGMRELARQRGYRSMLFVPLLRDGTPIGVIAVTRVEPGPFVEHHVQLLQTFADQAVIAIENVRLFDEVQAKTGDLEESLQQQTATADVLEVISRSAFDLTPVFETVAESSVKLCGSEKAIILRFDGELLRTVAAFNAPHPLMDWLQRNPIRPGRHSVAARAGLERRTIHVQDVLADPEHTYGAKDVEPFRTVLGVPMLKGDDLLGVILVYHDVVRPFTDKQIALVETFADQAVIAIENVRLFEEVQAKTGDLEESLQQQTATAEVLKVISRSAFDLQAVFDTLLSSAVALSGGFGGTICVRDGDVFPYRATIGGTPEFAQFLAEHPAIPGRHSTTGRVILTGEVVNIPDILQDSEYSMPDSGDSTRSTLGVPLLRNDRIEGALVLVRTEPGSFEPRQIELVKTFADQAVIAIENVRLFDEVQAKTRDLTEALQFQTATSDVLKVISSSPDTLQPVLDVIVETSRELCGSDASTIYLLRDAKFHVAAQSGVITPHMERLRDNPQSIDQPGSVLARVAREKRTLHFPNIVDDPEMKGGIAARGGPRALLVAPLMREGQVIGAIVLRQSHLVPFTPPQIEVIETFADQAVIAISNVNLFEQVQERTRELSKSLDELRTAQDRLVQTEKLASLGQLTAGIAHEIKNPLNFVNNFSALSAELVDELNDTLKPAALNAATRKEVDDLTQTLKDNLEKVVQHGKRADSIVKNMLLHSREGSGEHRPTDINALLDESLNLAYHGARAEKREFNVTLQRDFDATAGVIEVFPQEITRVFLNLISNGFYAVTKRKTENGGSDFEPAVIAATRNLGSSVEIRIRDNGTGIPAEVKEKMFNPFFTTKPAGEGTGLGLSMSHDIIVKQHGGSIDVETEPGQFTEFRIVLPRASIIPEKRG
jgi:GAF domain-containing protein